MWRVLTENDIRTKLSDQELQSIRERAQLENKGDVVSDSITNVTNMVRGYVAGNKSNSMGADGTIPGNLINTAVSLLVYDLYSRTAGMIIDINDTRKQANSIALSVLRDVAAGTFAVEQPDIVTPTKFNDGSAAELAQRSKPLTREDMRGL